MLLNLLDMVDRNRFFPVVICPESSEAVGLFRERDIPVETTAMPWFTKKAGPLRMFLYCYRMFTFAFFLRGIIKRYKVVMIHANSFITAIYASVPAKFFKRPLVWHMHDIIEPGFFNKVFIRYAAWGAERIVCVSGAVRKRLLEFGVNPDKCRTVYNAVTPDVSQDIRKSSSFREEFNIDENTHLVGIIGNVCKQKAQFVFLEAAFEVLKVFKNVVFVIVGDVLTECDVSYKAQLESFIIAHRIENKIIFTGFREDVKQIIGSLEILVHPPILPEALGLVILEAMMQEKPVVASDIGGIPEIMSDGFNGLLVPPGDAHALAEAVCKLLGDPEMRKRLGREGKKAAAGKFAPDNFLKGIMDIYEELLFNKTAK